MSFSFRIDRALSVGIAGPLAMRRKNSATGRVPILMYHGINQGVGSGHPYFETNTSPAIFRRHLNILAQNRYDTVDLEAALDSMDGLDGGRRKVVITFDDGYADFYDNAFPVLAEHGYQATLFIVTGLTSTRRVTKNGKEYMTWSEVREVHARGIRIGSHSVSHGKLWNMTPSQIDEELRGSKQVIEDKLGVAVQSFAYPYAFPAQDKRFTEVLRERLQHHGYGNGVSTTIGTATKKADRYFLPRLPVNRFDDETFFMAKLEGGYEWLRGFQRAKKALQTGRF